MPTVYSASSSQWPLLQSKTEQKFKSGLFNVSAEFIRPVGNTDLPSVIVTSIGNVDVWPEPTVSVGTDGFERVNATGYGVWAAGVFEEKTLASVDITATLKLYGSQTNGTWNPPTTHYVFLKSFGSAAAVSYCTENEPVLTQMQFPEYDPYFIPQTSTDIIFSSFSINLGSNDNWYSNPATKSPITLTPTYSKAWNLINVQATKFGNVFEVHMNFIGVFGMNFGPFYYKPAADLIFP